MDGLARSVAPGRPGATGCPSVRFSPPPPFSLVPNPNRAAKHRPPDLKQQPGTQPHTSRPEHDGAVPQCVLLSGLTELKTPAASGPFKKVEKICRGAAPARRGPPGPAATKTERGCLSRSRPPSQAGRGVFPQPARPLRLLRVKHSRGPFRATVGRWPHRSASWPTQRLRGVQRAAVWDKPRSPEIRSPFQSRFAQGLAGPNRACHNALPALNSALRLTTP